MDEQLLTVDEMAETLKVPKSWLYSRTREKGTGAIPRVKVGKYIRFVESEVMDWLKRHNEMTVRSKYFNLIMGGKKIKFSLETTRRLGQPPQASPGQNQGEYPAMMILRPSEARGSASLGWLESRHSFSKFIQFICAFEKIIR